MTEEEAIIQQKEVELIKSQACVRLSQNPDFKVLREILESTQTKYRTMLEELVEDNRSNVLRGGIIAIKDVLALFDATASREKNLLEFLKEIKQD
jgi:predicted KAP-like P-loop ATPase